MVKGNFLTEDSYLGDIREPLTLNRYSYCIGNPLFYDDPSGHDPTPVGMTDSDAVEAYTIGVIMEHQDEVNQVMDYVFNWLGESSGLYNESTADQILDGFVAGFVGSYYDTWDTITSFDILSPGWRNTWRFILWDIIWSYWKNKGGKP